REHRAALLFLLERISDAAGPADLPGTDTRRTTEVLPWIAQKKGRPLKVVPCSRQTMDTSGSSRRLYWRGAGWKSANTAPCGSLTIEKRPVFGMSCGPTIGRAPSVLALSVLALTSVTMKYGIQYDGMCAGISFGFGIMPTPGCPLMLISVYSIPVD